MRTEIKWYFRCNVTAADKVFAKMTPYANFYKAFDAGKVEYVEDYTDDANVKLAYVEFPSKQWPELTERDFFNIMTECMAGNLCYAHSFGVQAIAYGGKDDKEQVARFTHQFDDYERSDAGTLTVYPEAASAEYANKLRQIAKIARTGDDYE